MRWVKLFLKFYWPGNTKIYALIAESYVFISEIAQRFATEWPSQPALTKQTTHSVFWWKQNASNKLLSLAYQKCQKFKEESKNRLSDATMGLRQYWRKLSTSLFIPRAKTFLRDLCHYLKTYSFLLREHSHMTSDVFWVFLIYLSTYPNQILYYMSLFSKIICSLTYLLTYLKIWRHMWMFPNTLIVVHNFTYY